AAIPHGAPQCNGPPPLPRPPAATMGPQATHPGPLGATAVRWWSLGRRPARPASRGACERASGGRQRLDLLGPGVGLELGLAEEVRDLVLGVLEAVRAVHRVLVDAGREVAADGALGRVGRVGRAHQVAVGEDGVLTLE